MTTLRADKTDFQQQDEPNICTEELEEAITSLKKRAIASDKLPNGAMLRTYEAIGKEFLEIYQKWSFSSNMEEGPHYLDTEKRLISLLPIFDKIINRILQRQLERIKQIDERQYAYRQGRQGLGNYRKKNLHQVTIGLNL